MHPRKRTAFLAHPVILELPARVLQTNLYRFQKLSLRLKTKKTLEVYVKFMEYTLEEVGKLNTGFLTSSSDKSGSEPILTEKKPSEFVGESILSEIRYGDFTFPISLYQDADGVFIHKALGRSLESFCFVKGTPKSGYDVHLEDDLNDSVISHGNSFSVSIDLQNQVEESWRQLELISEYYHSKRENKDFESLESSLFDLFSITLEKSDLDNVVDPEERLEACVIAILCCWEAVMKNHTKYTQDIADDCTQQAQRYAEEYKQKKQGVRRGKCKLAGIVELTKDTCELYSGAEPYLPQYCGMELSILYHTYLGNSEVYGEVFCEPCWFGD